MIKDLINTELKNLPIEGLDVHIIKKYEKITLNDELFKAENLSILLIRSGNLKIKLREITQDLTSHDLIVIPKDSYCTFLEVRDNVQLYVILFSSDFVCKNCLKKDLLDSLYFFITKEPLKIALEEKEYQVLSLIYKLIYYVNLDVTRNGNESDLPRISLNLFLYELKLIYSKHSANTVISFNRKENLVMQFLTILSIHYKKQHYVKFYAGALFVTAGYLDKVVKEITGKSPKSLIIDSLISEAKILLENPHFTIAEITQEMEFSSVSVFSNFFKKHTSTSPSIYRSKSTEGFTAL
ncbi:AraC family transcriptional regulator [Flavobacterium sp. MMS24-S5]|uniref:helix-turn-helix transcriptional regulator n=1 Tax=Flavobacterium sp. MMS24-S5 TaxID=3416605 RepID=UPI003D03CD23